MTREVMRYKLNELRMMLNDGEHTEEQGILVEIIKELDKAEPENKGEEIPTPSFKVKFLKPEEYPTPMLLVDNKEQYSIIKLDGLDLVPLAQVIDKLISVKPDVIIRKGKKVCPNCGADMREPKGEKGET